MAGMIEWVPLIIVMQGGVKIAELEGDPLETYLDCDRYATHMAQDYINSWVEAHGAARNDIPMLIQHCNEKK